MSQPCRPRSTPPKAAVGPRHSRTFRRDVKRWSTIVATVASTMMMLDMTIVLVALPSIAEDLGLTLSGGQWIINGYSLAFASLMLSVGSLSDLVGRRTIFLIGQVIFVLASAACMVAGDETFLVAARIVQGTGGALVFGTSVPLLSDAFAPHERAQRTKAMAAFAGISASSSALGPLIGGFLVENGDWTWIFAVNVPIGFFVIVATLAGVPDMHRSARLSGVREMPPVDPLTMILATAMLFALNYGLINGADEGWTNGWILLCFSATILTGVWLVSRQLNRGNRAMIDVRLFSIPSFSTVAFSAFAARLFSFGLLPYLTLWLSGHVGLSPLRIGYVTMALALPIVLAAPLGLALGKIIPLGWVQAIGITVVAGGLMLGFLVHPDSSWPALVPAFLVMGVGTGIMIPHLLDLAVSVVPRHQTGTASGIANTSMPLGTSFGVALYGAFLTGTVERDLAGTIVPEKLYDAIAAAQFGVVDLVEQRFHLSGIGALAREAFVDGLHGIFVIAAVIAVIGAIACALFIRDRDIVRVEEGEETEA